MHVFWTLTYFPTLRMKIWNISDHMVKYHDNLWFLRWWTGAYSLMSACFLLLCCALHKSWVTLYCPSSEWMNGFRPWVDFSNIKASQACWLVRTNQITGLPSSARSLPSLLPSSLSPTFTLFISLFIFILIFLWSRSYYIVQAGFKFKTLRLPFPRPAPMHNPASTIF